MSERRQKFRERDANRLLNLKWKLERETAEEEARIKCESRSPFRKFIRPYMVGGFWILVIGLIVEACR